MEIMFANQEKTLGFLVLNEGEIATKIKNVVEKEDEIEPIPCNLKGRKENVFPICHIDSVTKVPYITWDNTIIGDDGKRVYLSCRIVTPHGKTYKFLAFRYI